MGSHMKTTVDIANPLLEQARRLANREGITLKAVLELGLRRVLAENRSASAPFRLRDASFCGEGLNPELADAGWERLRDLAYDHAP